jgi:hypothetical protein
MIRIIHSEVIIIYWIINSSQSDPMVKVVCEVGSAHNMATYLTKSNFLVSIWPILDFTFSKYINDCPLRSVKLTT